MAKKLNNTFTATVGDCTDPLPPLLRWRTGTVYGARALGLLTRFSFPERNALRTPTQHGEAAAQTTHALPLRIFRLARRCVL